MTSSQLVADLLVFAKVVELGSFTGAASSLGMAKSQVTKQVRRLEASLGTTLLHRTTRRMAMTEAGQALQAHAQALTSTAAAALDAVARHREAPAGRLRVSSSVAYGQHVLAPLLPAFFERYPAVELELLLVDRPVDLLEEGLDLVLRLSAEPPPALAGRPLHPIPFVVCGSPRLIGRHPVSEPEHLRAAPCMSFSAQARRNGGIWAFQRGRERQAVEIQGPVVVNSSDVVRALVLNGLGFGLLPAFVVQDDLASQRLVTVLPDWQVSGPFGPMAWVLWQPQRVMPPKMRVFIDHLVDHLGGGQQPQRRAARQPSASGSGDGSDG